MLEAVFGTIVAVAFVAAFTFWFIGVVNMFRVVANRKDGVPLFPNWFESPFNILFRPSQLTDRGIIARRKCFYGFIGFILSCAILGVVAVLQDSIS
jgi:hypothetical protein